MSSIGAGFSMSLDGFIADENNDASRVFAWMMMGDTEVKVQSGEKDYDFKMSETGAERFEEAPKTVGAIISGRGMFDTAHAWGGRHPMGVPVVILTHSIPQEWADSPHFTFVTEGGLDAALAKAREIAGDKALAVGGAEITRQFLKAGLLDEIGIDLVPVLLGKGVRLFESLGIEPIELDCTSAVKAPGVVHLSFKVKK
ncbi:MAG: deaminase [Chloroflexi bacterium]|nr:deaminase [Chloroflexota bacterium]